MKTITKNTNILFLLFIILIISSCNNDKDMGPRIIPKDDIDYIDGPYVFHEDENVRIITINQHDEIFETIVNNVDSLLVQVPNQIPDHFYVKLNPNIHSLPTFYEEADKIFAVSDIEGNYYSFVNLLIGNKITDENLNWIYETGHLVLNGDFVDRGAYVTQVLWLIYKLEQEATAAGGHVHFILGNHEVMNMKGNWKYVDDKYVRLARDLGILQKDFYNVNNELGRWMYSKNIIEKIGDNLFVHAGISPIVLNQELSLADINQVARTNFGADLENDTLTVPNFIFGRFGPLWYRGLVKDYKYYPKATINEVNNLLEYYESERVVVGHTIVDEISTDYNGKVVRTDLIHPVDINSPEVSKALLIEGETLYKVDDTGKKTEVK